MTLYDDEYLRLKMACRSELPHLQSAFNALTTMQAAYDAADGTGPFGTCVSSGTAAGTIPANRLVKAHTDGTLLVGTLASKRVVGVNGGSQAVAAGTVTLHGGYVTAVAAEPITAGDLVKCADNGRILQLADADNLSTVVKTEAAGNFGNQPANDAIEVLSSSTADVTQTVTVIGTTQATDTVVVETITLTGTTPVESTKQDWGFILAVKLSATCAGTVTVQEASAHADIITLATTVNSAGVHEVAAAAQGCHGLIPYINAAGASTKVVGVKYEPATGAAETYMAEALNGTTAAPLPAAANRITELYLGDVATGTVATVYTNATEDDEQCCVGKAISTFTTGGTGTILLRA